MFEDSYRKTNVFIGGSGRGVRRGALILGASVWFVSSSWHAELRADRRYLAVDTVSQHTNALTFISKAFAQQATRTPYVPQLRIGLGTTVE